MTSWNMGSNRAGSLKGKRMEHEWGDNGGAKELKYQKGWKRGMIIEVEGLKMVDGE